MRKTIPLWAPGEYTYPLAGSFVPNITAYVHDDEAVRPAMLVVPGGGYAMVSPTEGQIVAERFHAAGFQAFVLTYTTNMFQVAPLGKQPLRDISRAVRCIRKNAAGLRVDPGRVACVGFSAGGHLTASLAVHYDDPELASEPDAQISNRPDAVVLSYPVITSGELAHRGSFDSLLGKEPTPEQLAWASLENHVTANTPPAFLWQTLTDELVPVENSMLFARSCRKAGVPCELHLYMKGRHGMSLANEAWAAGDFGEDSVYTMEQTWQTMHAVAAGNPEAVPELFLRAAQADSVTEFAQRWNEALSGVSGASTDSADPSVRQWPDLALAWLEKVLNAQETGI